MLKLEEMTLTELKEIAKENNIKNISILKKEELIEILNTLLNDTPITTPSKKEEKINEESSDDLSGYKLTNEGDEIVEGILDILPDGYGFLRGDNYLSTPKDVYISVVQIRI